MDLKSLPCYYQCWCCWYSIWNALGLQLSYNLFIRARGEAQWPGRRWKGHLPPYLQDAKQLVIFKVETMDQYRVHFVRVCLFGMRDNFWADWWERGELWCSRCAGDLECCLYAVQCVENWSHFQSRM